MRSNRIAPKGKKRTREEQPAKRSGVDHYGEVNLRQNDKIRFQFREDEGHDCIIRATLKDDGKPLVKSLEAVSVHRIGSDLVSGTVSLDGLGALEKLKELFREGPVHVHKVLNDVARALGWKRSSMNLWTETNVKLERHGAELVSLQRLLAMTNSQNQPETNVQETDEKEDRIFVDLGYKKKKKTGFWGPGGVFQKIGISKSIFDGFRPQILNFGTESRDLSIQTPPGPQNPVFLEKPSRTPKPQNPGPQNQ